MIHVKYMPQKAFIYSYFRINFDDLFGPAPSDSDCPDQMANTPSSQSTFFNALDTQEPHAGIGLSDPRLNYEVRKKLDAMNKLHSTGYACLYLLIFTL
jgi:hypothetical protein